MNKEKDTKKIANAIARLTSLSNKADILAELTDAWQSREHGSGAYLKAELLPKLTEAQSNLKAELLPKLTEAQSNLSAEIMAVSDSLCDYLDD